MDNPTTSSFVATSLIPISKIPEKYRKIFCNYTHLNRVQSTAFPDLFNSNNSIVISAPTGSGKTAIFELAIVKLLIDLEARDDIHDCKIIYVAPMKALCEERTSDWHSKFSSYGLKCVSATGDSDFISLQDLALNNVIITTPEKWDSLTRRWKNHKDFVHTVALFMIDEVHLLNDETRGPTVEAIMSRMKTIENSKVPKENTEVRKIRFLAVSATIPNVEDVAEWLGSRQKPAKCFNFSDDVRPVKLNKVVCGYFYNPQTSTPFKFDLTLNYKLQSIILQYSNGKPTLIFCSTRKSVELTAKHLSQNLTITLTDGQKKTLLDAASKIGAADVTQYLIHGVGCHHAGMYNESRRIVEDLFRNGLLPILVTTSTLAMGVNLPAHLVIIKSTKYYTNQEYKNYSESAIMQMIGRAGRPQFDTTATAVILTTIADKPKFEAMVGGTQLIESWLHKHLTEHLNAEIVLRTITDIGVAMQWLTFSFLYIRARKNPKHYGISAGLDINKIDDKLFEMTQIEINKLARVGMINIDHNVSIIPTEVGSLMAKYYIHFETMKLFTEVQGTEVLQQILALIAKCHEFNDQFLRVNDKKTLNLLNKCKNKETIRFPLSGKIKTADMKINCIIQAVFGCLPILEPSLEMEAQRIMRIGERVSKCLAEYLENKSQHYSSLLSALILAKCFHCKLWENSPYISKQLTGIGQVNSTNLVNAGKTTFDSLLETNPRHLELIIHRKSPMGNNIHSQVEHLPKYTMALEEIKVADKKIKVNIILELLNAQNLEDEVTIDPQSTMSLLVGDNFNHILLYEKFTHSYMIDNPYVKLEIEREFTSEITIEANFISEKWAGIDCKKILELFSSKKAKQKADGEKKGSSSKPVTNKRENKLQALLKSEPQPQLQNLIHHYYKAVKNPHTTTNNDSSSATNGEVRTDSVTPSTSAANCGTKNLVGAKNSYMSTNSATTSLDTTKSKLDEAQLLNDDDEYFNDECMDLIEEQLLQSPVEIIEPEDTETDKDAAVLKELMRNSLTECEDTIEYGKYMIDDEDFQKTVKNYEKKKFTFKQAVASNDSKVDMSKLSNPKVATATSSNDDHNQVTSSANDHFETVHCDEDEPSITDEELRELELAYAEEFGCGDSYEVDSINQSFRNDKLKTYDFPKHIKERNNASGFVDSSSSNKSQDTSNDSFNVSINQRKHNSNAQKQTFGSNLMMNETSQPIYVNRNTERHFGEYEYDQKENQQIVGNKQKAKNQNLSYETLIKLNRPTLTNPSGSTSGQSENVFTGMNQNKNIMPARNRNMQQRTLNLMNQNANIINPQNAMQANKMNLNENIMQSRTLNSVNKNLIQPMNHQLQASIMNPNDQNENMQNRTMNPNKNALAPLTMNTTNQNKNLIQPRTMNLMYQNENVMQTMNPMNQNGNIQCRTLNQNENTMLAQTWNSMNVNENMHDRTTNQNKNILQARTMNPMNQNESIMNQNENIVLPRMMNSMNQNEIIMNQNENIVLPRTTNPMNQNESIVNPKNQNENIFLQRTTNPLNQNENIINPMNRNNNIFRPRKMNPMNQNKNIMNPMNQNESIMNLINQNKITINQNERIRNQNGSIMNLMNQNEGLINPINQHENIFIPRTMNPMNQNKNIMISMNQNESITNPMNQNKSTMNPMNQNDNIMQPRTLNSMNLNENRMPTEYSNASNRNYNLMPSRLNQNTIQNQNRAPFINLENQNMNQRLQNPNRTQILQNLNATELQESNLNQRLLNPNRTQIVQSLNATAMQDFNKAQISQNQNGNLNRTHSMQNLKATHMLRNPNTSQIMLNRSDVCERSAHTAQAGQSLGTKNMIQNQIYNVSENKMNSSNLPMNSFSSLFNNSGTDQFQRNISDTSIDGSVCSPKLTVERTKPGDISSKLKKIPKVFNAMNFEKSLVHNKKLETTTDSLATRFTISPKKKLTHPGSSSSSAEPDSSTNLDSAAKKQKTESSFYKNEREKKMDDSGSCKSVKWSSPLIKSPAESVKSEGSFKITRKSQCLGQFNFKQPQSQQQQKSKLKNSKTPYPKTCNFPLKRPKDVINFPITDQDCSYPKDIVDGVRDILSETFANDLLGTVDDSSSDKENRKFVEVDLASYVQHQQQLQNSQVEKKPKLEKLLNNEEEEGFATAVEEANIDYPLFEDVGKSMFGEQNAQQWNNSSNSSEYPKYYPPQDFMNIFDEQIEENPFNLNMFTQYPSTSVEYVSPFYNEMENQDRMKLSPPNIFPQQDSYLFMQRQPQPMMTSFQQRPLSQQNVFQFTPHSSYDQPYQFQSQDYDLQNQTSNKFNFQTQPVNNELLYQRQQQRFCSSQNNPNFTVSENRPVQYLMAPNRFVSNRNNCSNSNKNNQRF